MSRVEMFVCAVRGPGGVRHSVLRPPVSPCGVCGACAGGGAGPGLGLLTLRGLRPAQEGRHHQQLRLSTGPHTGL